MVLCDRCELEEFMVPGGWGYRLGLNWSRSPIDVLIPLLGMPAARRGRDKFCPQCRLRYKFLKIIAAQTET